MLSGAENHNYKHGHASGGELSPTYISWTSLRPRCENPNNIAYPRYGGRGIQVCTRWHRFENFLADMGERPDGLTLERIDNDGNYEPGNCKWATPTEQARNRCSNRIVQGLHLMDAAKAHGLKDTTLAARLNTGMSEAEALTKPLKGREIAALAEKSLVSYATFWARINTLGWSIEEALTTPLYGRR